MSLETVEKELERLGKRKTFLKPLHDRMEKAYRLWNNSPFKMPQDEGKWDSVTSNSPAVLANGVADRLAGAKRLIWLPVTDEVRKERQAITQTERLINAALLLNDERLGMIPEMTDLQAMLAWDAAVCGFVIPRVWMHEDDNNGGKFTVIIDAWDPRHVYWLSGTRGLIWVAYERTASIDELKDTYGTDVKATPNKNGEVTVFDIWDKDDEGIATDKEYLDNHKHEIGHPPVMVRPVGTARYVQRKNTEDTIKDLGQDVFVNNREIYETRNRSRTYRLTLVGRAARRPLVVKYDSSEGGRPPKIKGDPGAKGGMVVLDAGKGQDIEEFPKAEMTRDASILDQELDAELSLGGMAPIASGQLNMQLPYGGINLLQDAAMQRVVMAKLAVQAALAFCARELISQFKTGQFGEVTLQGVDGSNRAYSIKVKAADIDDEWQPKCTLKMEMPKDEQIQIAVATQEITSGLLSKREAREKHQLSEDLDLTEHLIDMERLDEVPGIYLGRVAAALYRDDPEGNAQRIGEVLGEIERRDEKAGQEQGVAVQPGIPIPAPPMAGFASRTTPPGRSGTRQVR